MKKNKTNFKILVLEDNEFYNTILTRQLKNFTDEIALLKGYTIDIDSYTSAHDCLQNIKQEIDIAVIDYYLGGSMNALEIMKIIKEKYSHCKVIIISQLKNIKTYYQTMQQGAYHFIFKDQHALANSCAVIEDILNESSQGKS